ncbi:hypothetical protein ACWX0K_14795 [Nitrobacteraceae bacterium UC4446_H13]
MATKKNMPTIGAGWVSVTDLKLALMRARDNRERQSRLLDNLSVRIAQRRTDTEHALAEITSPQRTVIVNRALSTFRGQLKRESVETRTAHVREAGVIANVAARAKQHFQSPVQILMREGLGSERRSRLLQQIEHSGSTELASLAALAASTGDKEMGAALISRVNRLDPGDRPFSPHALADALVGAEHRDITAAIMEVERIAEEAAHADTAFETGKPSSVRTIQAAILRREQAAIGADLDAFVEEEEK